MESCHSSLTVINDFSKIIKNSCSFGKLDHSVYRTAGGRVAKATFVGQTKPRRKEREKATLVITEGHHTQMCTGLWSWRAASGKTVPCPLAVSVVTLEGLQNVFPRDGYCPGLCSRTQNIKWSHLQDTVFWNGKQESWQDRYHFVKAGNFSLLQRNTNTTFASALAVL